MLASRRTSAARTPSLAMNLRMIGPLNSSSRVASRSVILTSASGNEQSVRANDDDPMALMTSRMTARQPFAAGVNAKSAARKASAGQWTRHRRVLGQLHGGLYGVYAGYNFQTGAWVVGVEGDFNGVANDETFTITTPFESEYTAAWARSPNRPGDAAAGNARATVCRVSRARVVRHRERLLLPHLDHLLSGSDRQFGKEVLKGASRI
jgi:hypothetical protein